MPFSKEDKFIIKHYREKFRSGRRLLMKNFPQRIAILEKFIPQMRYVTSDFILQQDGARCHTSKYTLAYIQEHVPDFLEPELWPPHSPDLNPLDYCIWGYLEKAIHDHQHIDDLEVLKTEIIKAWDAIPQEVASKAVASFRKHLRIGIKAEGGLHI